MQCKQCGRQVSILDRSCSHCGHDLTTITLSPSPSKARRKTFSSGLAAVRQEIDAAVSDALAEAEQEVQHTLRPSSRGLKADAAGRAGGVAQSTAAPGARPAPFACVQSKDVHIDIEYVDWINYSLVQGGVPQILRLTIQNTTDEDADNLFIKIWIPDYGDLWQKTVPCVPAGTQHTEEHIRIHLYKKRLEEVDEAENAVLQVEVTAGSERLFACTYPMRILAFNEWVYIQEYPQLVAAFIMPNNSAVEQVVNAGRAQLAEVCGDTSFDGYQSSSPAKTDCMVEALYRAMQKDLNISYINPPASFETTGQKIFLPQDIVAHQRGTCLDLSLFYAACLERIGLHPLIFLVPGHAFIGYWREPDATGSRGACIDDFEEIRSLIDQDLIRPVNSTTFCAAGKSFAEAIGEAQGFLQSADRFEYAVDVLQARRQHILPMD